MNKITLAFNHWFYNRASLPEFDAFFNRLLGDTSIRASWDGDYDAPQITFKSEKTQNEYTFGVYSGLLRKTHLTQESDSFIHDFQGEILGLNWRDHVKLNLLYEKLVKEFEMEARRQKNKEAEEIIAILNRHP